MTLLRDIAKFSSAHVAPMLPDECQVNPKVYGAELAYWLCAELAKRGVVTSYPHQEDWGWFIEFLPETGSEFAIHCGNVDGARDIWLLSLHRRARKMFGRDKPSYAEAFPVVQGIRTVLEESAHVRGLAWLYEAANEA
ncbi:hypothetical protein ACFJGW_00960 [Burkholderiaceae bacterium UC74_6]